MKTNVSIQETKIIMCARHRHKFNLSTDASHNTRCSYALNTQLPRIIAECTIHLLSSNGWAEFWPEPMKFLVDMLNRVH